MRKFLLVIVLLALSKLSISQVYTWNGSVSTDYQVSANWSPARTVFSTSDILSFNATTPLEITHVPNQTIGGITIASGTSSVSFDTDNPVNVLTLSGVTPLVFNTNGRILAANFLTIRLSNTAAFTLNTGTFGISPGTGGKIVINSALTLAGGKLDVDVAGTGGTTITGSVTYSSGTFNCANTSAIIWTATANYYHAFGGNAASAIPASSWQSGSTCSITGMHLGNIAPGGLGLSNFANFTWNCVSQFGNVDLLPSATTLNVNGTLNILNTNNKFLRFSTGKATINAGVYSQTTGNVSLQEGTDTTVLRVAGNFTHVSGFLNGVGGTGAGTAIFDLKKDVLKSGSPAPWSSTGSNSGAQVIFQFSGGTAQMLNITGTWNISGGRCNIVNNNSDMATGLNITGSLKVMNFNATVPATMNMRGIITGTGTVAYSSSVTAGTSLIYDGGFLQTASAIEYPATSSPLNLTINNSLGVNFPVNFSRTVAGTFSLLFGNLSMPGDTLFLTNTALSSQLIQVGGFIASGTLGRSFPTSGLPTSPGINGRFPFGSGVNDRSLNIFFTSADLTGGTAGTIYVSHEALINISAILPNVPDNGIDLDKKTNTNWVINPGTFDMGTGTTAALTAVAANIGSVDDYTYLRLTDGATAYGSLIPGSGTNAIPVVGKSALTQSDLNKKLYIGSNVENPLILITFTWTGLGGNTNWTNPSNWTGGVGYPSASTEVAIITNTAAPLQPAINTSTSINLYQLTVGAGMTLTMTGAATINVYDNVSFTGTAAFAPTSTFGYASSNLSQNIQSLTYGSLSVSGTAAKVLPGTLTVTGNYTVTGSSPQIGTGTFIYAGAGAQRVGAAAYYNLTITGNRGGQTIALGNLTTSNTIDVKNVFNVSGLSNYNVNAAQNFINFSSAGAQTIPGFKYGQIKNSGGGTRTLDNLGSTDVNHEIYCLNLERSGAAPNFTIAGSKVKNYVSGLANPTYKVGSDYRYNDYEITGNLNGLTLNFDQGELFISGKFAVTLTNFKQPVNTNTFFVFDGTGDQTIPAFKTNTATNTPAFKYPNIVIPGGNREITLGGAGTDTILITGSLQVPRTATYGAVVRYGPVSVTPFSAGKGFIVAGSTIDFSVGSNIVPQLIPSAPGTHNYNNLSVTGGTRIIESNNMTIGGNLYVSGNDTNYITKASPAVLYIGDGSTTRVLNVLGNVTLSGTNSPLVTGQLDLNPGTTGSTTLNISKSLLVSGRGQITSTGESNGTIVFKGIFPHTYTNSSILKNGFVNFRTGDGVTNSKLTLLSHLDLIRSATPATQGTITVLNKDSLDCGTFNVVSNTNNGTAGNGVFNLNAGATLITANTGGIEGSATNGTNGSIINDATIVKTYSPTASYIFNASTSTPFPAAITPMANLTIGSSAAVSLNKSIEASNTVTLSNASAINLVSHYLNLRSTASATARVAPVPDNANVNYGTGRFVVERHFPSRRAWRLITAPVTVDATKTVFNSWQMGGAVTSGEGTFVSGKNANPAVNGLDVSPRNNSSLKIGNALTDVLNTRTQRISGTAGVPGTPDNFGMFIFVRGDRSSTNLFNIPYSNATTIRDTGKIQIKSQTFTLTGPVATPTTGFELIGNPFASQVDISTVINSVTNIDKTTIYMYDPYLNTDMGGYVSFIREIDGTYSPTPESPGGLTSNIQSSQAIFVRRSTGTTSSTITFKEDDKTASTSLGQFRPVATGQRPVSVGQNFRTNLYLLNQDNSTLLADGTRARFDNSYSKSVDEFDALKLANTNEMLSLVRGGRSLAVESRSLLQEEDTLFLKLSKTTQRKYQLAFTPENLNPLVTAFLEDRYLETQTPVSLTSISTYDFAIDSDPKSAATDRFRIVFKPATTTPLPVTYKTIKAAEQKEGIIVEWAVENELNIRSYEVEKSSDGISFNKIGSVNPGAGNGTKVYNYLDVNVTQDNNFYRVRSLNLDGNFEYSRIVVVKLGKTLAGIGVYPNPVKGNNIGVAFNNMEAGIYHVKLMNTLGQTIMTKLLNRSAGSSMETLNAGSSLSAGIYQLEVTSPNKRISAIKVIVQ